MNKLEALRTYKKVPGYILKEYKDADKYQWYNTGDADLHPIRTELPEPPDWDKIENFGLPAHRQVFQYEEVPQTLKHLVKQVKIQVKRDRTLTSDQKRGDAFYDIIWDKLENNLIYKKILDWISEQWYYRINGKWVFINGKPTYIAQNHWFYLNYWALEQVDKPEYRERDREWFYAMQYFKEYTKVPKRDFDGNLFYNDDGSIVEEDVEHRTIEGVIVAKGRRKGDTSKATCDIFCDTTLKVDANCGIQGDKEDTGNQVFHEKLMYAYRRLPFIWHPKRDHNVQSELLFESKDIDESLNSKIDYASASPTAYDGRKLYRYYADEPGKIEKYSVDERHNIVRLCLRLGTKLIGFSLYTTTVNDMSSDSGKNFEALCRDSFYEQRTESGTTKSGMVFIHFPSDHGHEGFVGKYGESVREKPTEEQLKYIEKRKNRKGEYIGARESILIEREAYREAGQHEKVSQAKRLNPLTFAESFSPPANNVYFDMDIIENRIIQLKRDNKAWITGDLEGNPVDGVRFMPNNDGRFRISRLMPDGMSNQKYQMGGIWYPQNANIYVASADVFKTDKSRLNGYRMSDGGGAVKWKFDPRVDSQDKPVEEWDSGRFVCTYKYRPDTTDEFCEDMLKMCVYYGSLMYPESNIEHVYKYFIERGFEGYLLFDTDPSTGRPKNKPGFHTGGDSKKEIFNLIRNYIKMHGRREKHLDFLEECATIRDPDQMTDFDLFTACGGCLLAEQSAYGEYLNDNDDDIEIGDAVL